MNATITNNQIAVQIAVRPSENESGKWLAIDVPNGWDDVKRISKKVLEFNGENYTFKYWDSDVMRCYFKQTNLVAKIK